MHYLNPYSMMQREHIHILFILPTVARNTDRLTTRQENVVHAKYTHK